jgi:queuine tRNA-ribosyltransferase
VTFALEKSDGSARAGRLTTDHGDVPTPIFMPVGTQGTVKAMGPRDLEDAGARIILGNTYHLYLRPGTAVLGDAGGLHRFSAWSRPILTDSGGYQVFSLSDLRRIDEDGVAFKSHIDGSLHRFTAESVIDTQRAIGSDVMMVLDECTPYPCDEAYAQEANARTMRWAARCRERLERTAPAYGHGQALFAIVQGSVYPRVREESARALTALEFDGYAIGGLSVGEPADLMYRMTEVCTALLPEDRPRYLMGVGTPENIVESIARGIDMFDCVMPTRNGRNGLFFTGRGRVNIRNAAHRTDPSPVEAGCTCYGCRTFSRAYLHHLFKAGEILGLQIASMHNVTYYLRLVGAARDAILRGDFARWKEQTLSRLAADPAASLSPTPQTSEDQ